MTTCENVHIDRSDVKLICNKTKHIHRKKKKKIRLFQLPTAKRLSHFILSWIFPPIQSHYRKSADSEKTFFLSHSVNFSFIFYYQLGQCAIHNTSQDKNDFLHTLMPTHKTATHTHIMNLTNTHRVLNIHWAKIRVTCMVEMCGDRAISVSLPLIFDITEKWHHLQQ